jgi:hypothetical protein
MCGNGPFARFLATFAQQVAASFALGYRSVLQQRETIRIPDGHAAERGEVSNVVA